MAVLDVYAHDSSGNPYANAQVQGTMVGGATCANSGAYADIAGCGCTSGAGVTLTLDGYTDSTGHYRQSSIPWTCSGGAAYGTVAANGMNTQAFNITMGSITGDVGVDVTLTPANSSAPPGQVSPVLGGLGNLLALQTTGAAGGIQNLGNYYLYIAIAGIALVFFVVLVVVMRRA